MSYRRWFRLRGERGAARREVDEELESHIAMRTESQVGAGVPQARARAEAEARLGDRGVLYASARDRDRRLKRAEWADGIRQDLRFAVRRAVRTPGATGLALLTFALGIGLTTAGFAVVDNVLIRALPYPESDRLVALRSVDEEGRPIRWVSAASWRQWAEHGGTLASNALHYDREWTMSGGGGAYRVRGQAVVGDFFATIGAPLLLGRAFTPGEVESGERLVVVSERLWRSALGGSRGLPLELQLDGRSALVVGVVPAGLGYPVASDLWLGEDPADTGNPEAHTWVNWYAVGRLLPGVTVEQASADLSRVARGILEANPLAIYSHGVVVEPVRDFVVGDVGAYLLLLMGAVGFVLLIACANLSGLGLARAAARTHEMGVRAALGAGRLRLVRQLLIEHVTLALAGGAAGVLLAFMVTGSLATRFVSFLPRADEIRLDLRVLLFAFGVSLVAGVAAGVLPALRSAASGVRSALVGGRGAVSGGRGLPGAALVVAEVALALVLVTGSGLLARSFSAVIARDLGFRTDGVITARMALTAPAYDAAERQLRYWEELTDRLRRLPSVAAVGFAHAVPGLSGSVGFVEVSGRPPDRDAVGYRVISDDYLDVLGVRVTAGRGFDARDGSGSPRVALVNAAMAREYWPDRDPTGQQVKAVSMEQQEGREWITVVGVVGDVRHFGHESDVLPEMFVLYRQVPTWTRAMTVVVRTAGSVPPGAAMAGIGGAVRDQDPQIAAEIATLESHVDGLVSERRFALGALGSFALLSLTLAAIGLYGMLSFLVARRTREIGIRAALGAGTGGIIGLILRSALAVVLVGVAAGLGAAFWLTGLMRTMLVEIRPHDPVSFAAAIGVLILVAVTAALVPALRAARMDPLDALRTEET